MAKRRLSETHKQKISESMKKYVRTEEHRRNLSRARKGMKFSESHRKALSEAQKRIGTIPPSRKGKIPWNFQNITPIHERIRKSPEYTEWRENVFVRDNFTCQICRIRGGKLRANHIKKFSDYPDLRLEPTNGITICETCDIALVFHHEKEWEPYFNFNLLTREIMHEWEPGL